jgi:hypothetical protein
MKRLPGTLKQTDEANICPVHINFHRERKLLRIAKNLNNEH